MSSQNSRFTSRKFLLATLVLAWIPLQPSFLQAQLTRGFVSGTVADPSTAVIVGARVTLTNNATNVQRETLTNQFGIYRFVAVEPGTYDLEFAYTGFQTSRVPEVSVSTAEEVVLNQILEVRPESTVVEVRETPPGVEIAKATPTLQSTLEGRFVSEVPLTGGRFRNINILALLAPTVTRAPGSNEFAANGQRARNNNFLIDGTDNNDLSVTVQSARVLPEAVAEYQVQTSAYSAEYGRNSGAQVSVVTRSGANALHGEVWDYYSANWMEAVSLLNKRAGLNQTARFVHNQAGGDLGGPLRKDRTFFFGLFEANRRREAPDARNAGRAIIPTPVGFAALSTVPLGAGQTPQSRQAVLNALSFLPEVYPGIARYDNLTTQNINGVPIEMGTVRIPLARPHDFWYALGRIDHHLSEQDSLSYRYHLDKRSEPDSASNLQFGSRFSAAETSLSQNHALSHIRAFGPRFLNEFRFAYVRRNLAFPENDPRSPSVEIGGDYGVGVFVIGGRRNFPQGRISNVFQWQNVSTALLGRHSLKMGADIRRNRLFNLAAFHSKGTWRFDSLADFLNNRAFSLEQAVNQATYDARQTNQFYFFQDDFKVTKNLTLNLGLRYEYSGVPLGFFGAANAQVAAVGVPLPVRPDKNNWAPRFGFAYSPSVTSGWRRRLFGEGQTAFRGGFGIGYDVLFYNILTVNASNYPRVVNSLTSQPETINLFPTLAPKQTTVPSLDPLATFTNSPTDTQNPTTHFWSFSIQRQLGTYAVAEIGYTGNRSYHQIRFGQTNPGILTEQQAQTVIAGGTIPGLQARRLNPAWGSRQTIEATALAEYHALFLRLDKRMARGLLFGANYTWSANLSDNDEALGVTAIANSSPGAPQNFFDYRNEWSRSVFDRPHRFVFHYSYEFPWLFSSAASHPVWKHILGGWQVAGFSEWQSGQPFTIRTGVDSGGSGSLTSWRPHFNPNGVFREDPVEGNFRTFQTPITGEGRFLTPLTRGGLPLANSMPHGGNLGRNTLRGSAFTNWNFSLMKTISVTERWRVQLRSDWINLWNHRNFPNPESRMNSPAFGTNTDDLIGQGNRTMLASVKIRF